MAHFQNHYSVPEAAQTDEFGNPIRRTDEYGNPIPKHETDRGIAGVGGQQHGLLHRTGSSSSSSSEDEGTGRKKKGLKEKLKEKLPGGHKDHDQTRASSTTTPGQGPVYHEEKKGIIDKIKEKVPGLDSP